MMVSVGSKPRTIITSHTEGLQTWDVAGILKVCKLGTQLSLQTWFTAGITKGLQTWFTAGITKGLQTWDTAGTLKVCKLGTLLAY